MFINMTLLDGTACALLAAAATARARGMGAHVTGALVLGCLCGLAGPLLREAFLHGASGTGAIAREFPASALVGAISGLVTLALAGKARSRVFDWLDGSSMGLASGVGATLALPELGIVGALTIGLVNGLAPGLVRDISLGDTAMLVEKDWYATASALGCIASIAFFISFGANEPKTGYIPCLAAILGFLVIICIRSYRECKQTAV